MKSPLQISPQNVRFDCCGAAIFRARRKRLRSGGRLEIPLPVGKTAMNYAGSWTSGGPQQTSMNVMRSCTLIEVRRSVRRVVTWPEPNMK